MVFTCGMISKELRDELTWIGWGPGRSVSTSKEQLAMAKHVAMTDKGGLKQAGMHMGGAQPSKEGM